MRKITENTHLYAYINTYLIVCLYTKLIKNKNNMANWNTTDAINVTIWITLKDLKQLKTNYGESGNLKMSDLTFYNNLSSNAERPIAAKMLAVQIDNILLDNYRCEYESGINASSAVNGMIATLSNPDKLVSDFADTCDQFYKFLTE
ncbi:MAG: hypothetical protein JKY02_10995 [Flavobacteriaceae bacterium]|nr:hypothetical protein [Flavobacteriaceae bacterium]